MEKLTIKDVVEGMHSATESNICWWAFFHMEESLKVHEDALRSSEDASENIKATIKYHIVETKKILVELYDKLMAFDDYKNLIEKPAWMDEFLDIENP